MPEDADADDDEQEQEQETEEGKMRRRNIEFEKADINAQLMELKAEREAFLEALRAKE